MTLDTHIHHSRWSVANTFHHPSCNVKFTHQGQQLYKVLSRPLAILRLLSNILSAGVCNTLVINDASITEPKEMWSVTQQCQTSLNLGPAVGWLQTSSVRCREANNPHRSGTALLTDQRCNIGGLCSTRKHFY